MTLKQLNDQTRIEIFHALSDEKRINMIRLLTHEQGQHMCTDIGRSLNISKSNGSYHLKILSAAGLVLIKREGVTKYVNLNQEIFDNYLPGFLATL